MRFATMQMKAAIIEVISKFEVTVNAKTSVPFNIHPNAIFLEPMSGIWLDFKPVE